MVESFYIVKLLLLTTLAFVVAIAWTPLLTSVLYKMKMGKRIRDKAQAPIFASLHKDKAGTPTMGGVIVWGTTLAIVTVFALCVVVVPEAGLAKMNILSRGQTWLPLFALVSAGILGLADDFFNVKNIGGNGGGIKARHRIPLYTVIAAVGAWWFFVKLGFDILHIPFIGDVTIGWWYIPMFILILVGTSFSVNQTDGLDGLAGGTLASAFAAYAIIALLLGRYELAGFCGVVLGALLAFLWFNIYPARFFMGDTGAMSLGVTLAVVAMLTNTALFLPIIGLVFVVEGLTTIAQLVSKKLFGRKIFLVAPIHHHFEAKGWPEPKVVMRFWVVSWVSAALGIALFVLDLVGFKFL